MLSGSHVLFHLVLMVDLEVNVTIPGLQMRRLRCRQVKYIVQTTQQENHGTGLQSM